MYLLACVRVGVVMADEVVQGGGVPVQGTDAPVGVQAPSEVVQATSTPAESTSGFVSIRDAAKSYGVDLSSHASDESALAHLANTYQQSQQSQQLAPYAQRYLQHAAQFEQWMREQAAQQAKPAEKPRWWNPPEFNSSWRQLLTRDPDTGEVKLAPGSPPDVLPKFLAYEQYRRDFAERLTSDPEGTLRPFIEGVSQDVAKQLIGQYFSQYDDQSYAQQFVAQHSSWLHAKDTNGNLFRDPATGQPVLSQEGRRFREYVVRAERAGIANVREQEDYARRMLASDLIFAQYQGVSQKNEQIKNDFLAANRQPNYSGVPAAQPEVNMSVPFNERLRQAFAANGVTDQSISTSS